MRLKKSVQLFFTMSILLNMFTFVHGQQSTVITFDQEIQWERTMDGKIEFWGAPYFPWSFEGAGYDGQTVIFPVFSKLLPVSENGSVSWTIRDVVWTELSSGIIPPELESELRPEINVVEARKDNFIQIRFIPLIKSANGSLKAVSRISLELHFQTHVITQQVRNERNVNVSALNDGTIYKIPVSTDGIYKLDQNYLNSLGIDLKNVQPSGIKVYGSGSGPVPERISLPRVDDLVEIPLQGFGLDDGKFDQDDYLLFYAQGPDQWVFNPTKKNWEFVKNIYSDKNFYFIKVSDAPGKRISSIPDPENSSYYSTDYDNYKVHEVDKVNLLAQNDFTEGTGQSWYGESFYTVKEQDFLNSFQFEHINFNEPLQVYCEMAARNFSTSVMSLTINDRVLQKSISGVTSGVNDTYARKGIIQDSIYLTENLKTLKLKTTATNAWLDKLVLGVRSTLIFTGRPVYFSDKRSLGMNAAGFRINKAQEEMIIWDITDPLDPVIQDYTNAGGQFVNFSYNPQGHARFVAFQADTDFPNPGKGDRIPNQNLHGITQADMIIVYYRDWKDQALKLAAHRESFNGFKVAAVDIDQIFNEFSSGRQDPGAIRDFVKMVYDRSPELRFLLLFGDGSYDYKALHNPVNNDNYITVYQTKESLSPTSGYVSDDFYTLLSDNEGDNLEGGMDIAVGRLPARSAIQAQYLVDKIISYETSPSNNGDWVNRLVFMADDEDSSIHLDQTEKVTKYIEQNYPVFNIEKIYLDAYKQEVNAGGHRYPDVNKALADHIYKGILSMTYVGHGGPGGFAQERILKIEDIYNWNNGEKLPLLVTATCSFTGFDDPSVNSAGEATILRQSGGVISLLSTVRVVYSAANSTLIDAVYGEMFKSLDDQAFRPLGEIIRTAKNKIGDTANKRKFLLFGDPAMSLIQPGYRVFTTHINGIETGEGLFPDTLHALSSVKIEGYVGDHTGQIMTSFNGELNTIVFDKHQQVETLQNDTGSPKRTFGVQNNILFKGISKVEKGMFSVEFTLPKDINYEFGKGKISYYYDNKDNLDGAGYYNKIVIGGSSENTVDDQNGPEISLFINHTGFLPGDVTGNKPILLAYITDESGINVSGNSIGHDIKAVLDDDPNHAYILNDFWKPELNNFKAGWVNSPLGLLEEGNHTIYVEAWDLLNNRGSATLDFIVATSEEQAIKNLFNFPNPVTDATRFYFEHTLPDATLELEVNIFDLNGKHVKTVRANSYTDGFKSEDTVWDGMDSTGQGIPVGVYIYSVKVYSRILNKTVESDFSRLVLIK